MFECFCDLVCMCFAWLIAPGVLVCCLFAVCLLVISWCLLVLFGGFCCLILIVLGCLFVLRLCDFCRLL